MANFAPEEFQVVWTLLNFSNFMSWQQYPSAKVRLIRNCGAAVVAADFYLQVSQKDDGEQEYNLYNIPSYAMMRYQSPEECGPAMNMVAAHARRLNLYNYLLEEVEESSVSLAVKIMGEKMIVHHHQQVAV